MKPGEILLDGGNGAPFPSTLGSPGLEMAAGMIVVACALYENRWQPVTWPMICLALIRNVRANRQPWAAINVSPHVTAPDFTGLADKGLARFTQSNRERSPIELTDQALDLIRAKWWRPGEEPRAS